MDKPIVLFESNGFQFTKLNHNNYNASFSVENPKIHLAKIINFEFIQLIYKLNPDIYEYVHLEKINEKEAIITLIMKPFFEDLGLPQKYSYMHMKKTIYDNKIVFDAQAIRSFKPDVIPPEAQSVSFSKMTSICHLETAHKIRFTYNVCIDEDRTIPPFVEKFIGIASNKIFTRVKQFIENVIV